VVDVVLAASLLLLAVAVVGSFVPLVPAGLLSLAGVYLYWFLGADPLGPLALASFTVVGVVAFVFEQFAGAVAAKASGASNRTTLAAAAAGVALFFVAGPVGILAGILVVVLVAELIEGADPRTAARRSAYTLAGMLASAGVQFLLTASILAGFVLAVFVL